MDHEAQAKRYRDQAEEFRAKSELMADETARGQYQKIADSYDDLANNEESLVQARNS
ncbi:MULTISPECIES: hypothetical protein [unclassified Bradyrhizobium]|jgi:hypothetical protein|uniref:hypothetical protein n=1 Tax=unclassified Bradyrhizobium TaxID=2631580 RepID=UPI0003041FF0|nr:MULTISPECIES: hypothetical protein [unclassified Bradyrhizobium]